MELAAADLYPIRDLYNRGLYRQALAAGASRGPIRTWAGPAGRLLAGRLCIQLGAPKTGHRLHLLAYRESPAYLEAVYYHARYRLEQFGPLSCWEFAAHHTDWTDAPPELRADWAMVRALAAARLNDADQAEKLMTEADRFAADRAWLAVERASVFEALNRTEEALQSARTSLELSPWFRPGVQAVSQLLLRVGEDAQAEELLREAATHLESSVVVAQLAVLLYDRQDFAGARTFLDQYDELTPLREPESTKWLTARRADVAYRLGEISQAAEFARQIGEPFYEAFAAKLEADGPLLSAVRVAVPPPPANADPSPLAVYAQLATTWNQPVPTALEAAPALDGTPDVGERLRFEQAGWRTREFTLAADPLRTLLERGVPVIVTLVDAGFGQPRLIVGYDPVRNSVQLSDGVDRRPTEAPLSVLLERFAASGPRALAAVPPALADRLDDLNLPDADLYDAVSALLQDLRQPDYSAAKTKLDEFVSQHPTSRLARLAMVAFARATANPVQLRDAVQALRQDFPHDNSLVLAEAAALRELGRMPERKALLADEGHARTAEPLLAQSLAQMMLPHPTERDTAARLLRNSIRQRPQAAPGYYLLGTLRWEQQRFRESLDLYRFAACLDDREDQFTEAYARAAEALGRGSEAVRLFQQRATRNGVPYPPGVKALADVLENRNEDDFARAALDHAVLRADNQALLLAELRLARAEWLAARGKSAAALMDLEAARPDTPPSLYWRAALRVQRLIPDYPAAAAAAQALVELEPTNPEAIRLQVGAVAEVSGRTAAHQVLARACQRYPLHYGLAKLRAEFAYPDQDEVAVLATRTLLELCPHDAWALRQLAMLHADRKEHAQAQEALERSVETEPTHPSYFAVSAHALRRADRTDDALAKLREALTLYPDHELAVFELVQLSPGRQEKEAALEFIAENLHGSDHTGEGLLAYFSQAAEMIETPDQAEELLAECQQFLEERPDLWQAWSTVTQLLLNARRAEEALALAQEATERFPLVTRVWIDLALTDRALDRLDDRLVALEEAVALAPASVPAARELAEALDAADRPDDALGVLERLVTRAPADAYAHTLLAERLWHMNRGREAFDRAKQAVKLDTGADPRAETAWAAVLTWADRVDAPEEPLELARTLTRERAGDPRAWLRLARTITESSQIPEALEALDAATRLDPRNVEAYDLKAERLAAVGQFDEALRAARPETLSDDLPLVLQGRAAWVEARRGNYAAAIPPMQALVAVDPEYIWGWQQLAEWYNDTGRSESYREAADEFLRLRPDHPMPLTMRGEARLQTGDRDGGKEDLREALRIHPAYSPAAVILFDACLADDEPREARTALAVLQEHMTGPEVLVKQVQFATRTQDPTGAERAFRELALLPGEQPAMFLQIALNEMLAAGLLESASETLRQVWTEPTEPVDGPPDGPAFNPWAAILWLDTPSGMVAPEDQKLAAVDTTLKAYPGFAPALDRRAELLAEIGQFDAARAACVMPGRSTPIALRGRLAWVEAQAGDPTQAAEMMELVVRDEPDYSWGWRQLTLWYDRLDRPHDCARAADNLVRLNPVDPVAYVIRGEARQAGGDGRGARDDFERAFELDPDFPAAGLHLATAQLDTDDLIGAAKTLAALASRVPGPLVLVRQIRLAARQGDLDAARKHLAALATEPAASQGLVREALHDFTNVGWASEAEAELAAAVESGSVSATAAAVWADHLAASGHTTTDVLETLSNLARTAPAAGREATLHYAETLAGSGQQSTAVGVIQRFSELLRSEDGSWTHAGQILLLASRADFAAAWMSDYPERSKADAWMLRPALAANLLLRRDVEAAWVAKDGSKRDEESEDPLAEFPAWLAVFAAVEGETDAADGYLETIEPVGQPDGIRLLLAFAEALVTVQRAADKPRAFTEVKADLHAAAEACARPELPPAAPRWYLKVVNRLATDTNTLSARLWAIGQRIRPWVRE